MRSAALRLLCALASAAPNVNANVIAAYLQERDVYDPLLRLLASGTAAGTDGLAAQAALLLALLLTWRESRNAYATRLAQAPPQQLCTLLAACARLLSPPPRAQAEAAAASAASTSASPSSTAYATSLLTDAAAAAGWAAEAVFAAAWAPGTPDTRKEALLDAMAAR